jgi:hypothetical protein
MWSQVGEWNMRLVKRPIRLAAQFVFAWMLLACTVSDLGAPAVPAVLPPEPTLATPVPPVLASPVPEALASEVISAPLLFNESGASSTGGKNLATPRPGGGAAGDPGSLTETPFQPLPTASPTPEKIRFAVIGDYGSGEQAEADVADLVKSWDPEFILTVGDNNYPAGSPDTLDQNIGQFYSDYIYPYSGSYGDGGDTNRFFPTLGNHDLDSDRGEAYLEYFVLPGNERYYDFTWGPLHLFALNSDSREPDGVGSSSDQAAWLQERLAASTLPWQIVYAHHPPYSSGGRDQVTWIRWPFQEWGADVYLAGHDHFYERLVRDGFPYFINGLGGGAVYGFGPTAEGSQMRFNDDYGALLVEGNDGELFFQFITRAGQVIDTFTLKRP